VYGAIASKRKFTIKEGEEVQGYQIQCETAEATRAEDRDSVLAYIREEFGGDYSRFDELAMTSIKETEKRDQDRAGAFARGRLL
jgi:hypothetical protein